MIQQAIENEDFEGEVDGIPVLNYDSVIHAEVENAGIGTLHTEFDGNGYAYTTAFISSEIVKWSLETFEVVDRIDTYYSPGHLMIPGGDSMQPRRQIPGCSEQNHQRPLSAYRPGTVPLSSAD